MFGPRLGEAIEAGGGPEATEAMRALADDHPPVWTETVAQQPCVHAAGGSEPAGGHQPAALLKAPGHREELAPAQILTAG